VNQVVSSEAEHVNCSGGASNMNTSHFTKSCIQAAGGNGTEGYMRCRSPGLRQRMMMGTGSTTLPLPRDHFHIIYRENRCRLVAKPSSSDKFKLVMFYNQNQTNLGDDLQYACITTPLGERTSTDVWS